MTRTEVCCEGQCRLSHRLAGKLLGLSPQLYSAGLDETSREISEEATPQAQDRPVGLVQAKFPTQVWSHQGAQMRITGTHDMH